MIPRYLAAFGPATANDLQAWSGLRGLGPALERLRAGVRGFENEQGRVLLDVPDGPLPDRATPAPARFLAPFDNAILSHADRSRIVAAEHRGVLQRDRLMRTFLLDGFVAGTWRLHRGTLEIRPARALTSAERRELLGEAELLLAFLAPESTAAAVRLQPSG